MLLEGKVILGVGIFLCSGKLAEVIEHFKTLEANGKL
jgi:hypothetical protein